MVKAVSNGDSMHIMVTGVADDVISEAAGIIETVFENAVKQHDEKVARLMFWEIIARSVDYISQKTNVNVMEDEDMDRAIASEEEDNSDDIGKLIAELFGRAIAGDHDGDGSDAPNFLF